MTRKFILTILLVLSLSFSSLVSAVVQAETEYVIALVGPTWKDSIIHVFIDPSTSESWWNPAFLNATLHGISQWNEAISYFAANHSDFAYLSRLRIEPQVYNSPNADLECVMSWVRQFGNVTCEAGLTRTTSFSGIIINSSLTVSAYDCLGNVLSEADSQNVVLHELGHVLGLAHSNYTGDLMYFSYTLGSPVRAISTLDLYGVGTVFRWMATSLEFDQANQGSPIYSVTLSPDIAYEHLAISEKNLPPQSPLERIRTNFGFIPGALSNPNLWILMSFLTVVVVAGYLVLRRMRRGRISSKHLDFNKTAT